MAERIKQKDRQALIVAIASREHTAKELSTEFGYTVEELKAFVASHKDEIQLAADAMEDADNDTPMDVVTPEQLSELWISAKYARLKRYEMVADKLFHASMLGSPAPVVLRELRFYMTAAANELGQLLHRGAGEQADGDKLQVEIVGVDPNSFS